MTAPATHPNLKISRRAAIPAFAAGLLWLRASSRPEGAAAEILTCAPGTPTTAGDQPATPLPTVAPLPTQSAIEPEQNPPGDIPDDQAFVTFTSETGGYSITMPEGWARQDSGPNVVFADKLHRFSVEIGCAAAPPTVESVTTAEVPLLAQTGEAFVLTDVAEIDLPAGPGILIRYQENSAPDEVTGKQYRLEVDRYELYQDGRQAAITLSAPAGSDNVDVSRQVSQSFRWTA